METQETGNYPKSLPDWLEWTTKEVCLFFPVLQQANVNQMEQVKERETDREIEF